MYLQGFGGLAFVLGWSGGFVLVAVLLAPYLRRYGGLTIPDFLAERYGGTVPKGRAYPLLVDAALTGLSGAPYLVRYGAISVW